MALILGLAKDKGGHIAVKNCIAEIRNAISIQYIRSLFQLGDFGGYESAGTSFKSALSLVEKAIIAVITCPEFLGIDYDLGEDYKLRSQILLNDLIAIRGSIINAESSAEGSTCKEYGIQVIDDSDTLEFLQ